VLGPHFDVLACFTHSTKDGPEAPTSYCAGQSLSTLHIPPTRAPRHRRTPPTPTSPPPTCLPLTGWSKRRLWSSQEAQRCVSPDRSEPLQTSAVGEGAVLNTARRSRSHHSLAKNPNSLPSPPYTLNPCDKPVKHRPQPPQIMLGDIRLFAKKLSAADCSGAGPRTTYYEAAGKMHAWPMLMLPVPAQEEPLLRFYERVLGL